jgi:hypothetical protein
MTTVSIPVRDCIEGEVHSISFDNERNVWTSNHDWFDETLVDLGLDPPKCLKTAADLKEYLDHEYDVTRVRLNHKGRWQWFGRCLCEIASGWITVGRHYEYPQRTRIEYLLDDEDIIKIIGEVAKGVVSYVMTWITPDMCQGKNIISEIKFLEVIDDVTSCLLFFHGIKTEKKHEWKSRKSRIYDIQRWSLPGSHRDLCDKQSSLLFIIESMCYYYPDDSHFSYRSSILPSEKLFGCFWLATESVRGVARDYVLDNEERRKMAYKDSTEHGIAQPYHAWWAEYVLYEIMAEALSKYTESVVRF